jgi:hypothetical protein
MIKILTETLSRNGELLSYIITDMGNKTDSDINEKVTAFIKTNKSSNYVVYNSEEEKIDAIILFKLKKDTEIYYVPVREYAIKYKMTNTIDGDYLYRLVFKTYNTHINVFKYLFDTRDLTITYDDMDIKYSEFSSYIACNMGAATSEQYKIFRYNGSDYEIIFNKYKCTLYQIKYEFLVKKSYRLLFTATNPIMFHNWLLVNG